jgi:hypothetical protein
VRNLSSGIVYMLTDMTRTGRSHPAIEDRPG